MSAEKAAMLKQNSPLSSLSVEALFELAQARRDDPEFWQEVNAGFSQFSKEALFALYRVRDDERFWDEIYPGLRSKAYQLINLYLRAPAVAEELAQETIIKVFTKFDPLREGANLLAFTLVVARNLALSEIRRRRPEVISTAEVTNEDEGDWVASIPDTHTPPPDEIVLTREQEQAVHHCLNCLNDRERVILLMWADDDSSKEIGQALGLSAGAVRTCLYRARPKFKQCYENYKGGQLL